MQMYRTAYSAIRQNDRRDSTQKSTAAAILAVLWSALVVLASVIAVQWSRFSRKLVDLVAFALIDFAAISFHRLLGLLVIALSLFLLNHFMRD